MALRLLQTQLRTFHFNILKCKCKPNPKCKEASLNDVSVWGSLFHEIHAASLCVSHVFACVFEGGSQDLGFHVMMSLIRFTNPHLDM